MKGHIDTRRGGEYVTLNTPLDTIGVHVRAGRYGPHMAPADTKSQWMSAANDTSCYGERIKEAERFV